MSKSPYDIYKQSLQYASAGGTFDPTSKGYVYVIGACGEPYVKIGSSIAPVARLRELQCGCWHELEVLGAVSFVDVEPIIAELQSHKEAAGRGHHYRGEWFYCSVNEALDCILEAAETLDATVHSMTEAMQYYENSQPDHEAIRRKELRVKLGID